MKRALLMAAVAAGALGLQALDNTFSNEFWCTWGYINADPVVTNEAFAAGFDSFGGSVCANVPAGGDDFDSVSWTERESNTVDRFRSDPYIGCVIILK
ncbi:MAG: hypothetical protein PHG71_06655 [Kiritimatiellae bacterium]|nr:hypothetical protein [Kiritimatiellia bacterium]